MNTPVRVACLGAGYFSRFHYDSWARIPEVDLVGACDLDLSKAQDTGVSAYDNLSAMLNAERPDVLDVVVPPAAHARAIQTALDAGVKTVICQKPFCASLSEARLMTEAAKVKGALLIVHENFRFQPWFRKIKTLIDQGLIGQVLQATFRLRPGDGQGTDAYLDRQPYFQEMPRFMIHETGVHYVDTFRYLLGNPTAVYADLRKVNPVIAGEDAGFVLFDFDGGARAVLDGNRNLDHCADNLRRTMGEALIEGTKGTLTLTGDGAVYHRAFHATAMQQMLPPDLFDGFGGDCVHALQTHVISGLLTGTAFENVATDYLKVIETEEAIYTSASAGQKIAL